MLEIKTEDTYKGTRILIGNSKRKMLNKMLDILFNDDYIEISLPIIQYQKMFEGKVGTENNNLMFNFKDRGNRDLCLSPEYTAVVQKLSKSTFKNKKDVKLFYIQECFRGEKPQKGRYREFTQLGIEVLNPSDVNKTIEELSKLSCKLIETVTSDYNFNSNVKRGLDYYTGGIGFEVSCESLGSSKQVCGGGPYENGVGFSLGIDRLILLLN